MGLMAENQTVKMIARWVCRLLLSGTFAYAAVQKILDPSAFAADIDHFRLLPHPLPLAVGVYLPWLELTCSVGVLCRWRERGALLLMVAMCGVFFAALASAWFRGLDINCGCFGHSTAESALPLAIARSLGLGLLALFLLKQSRPASAVAAGVSACRT